MIDDAHGPIQVDPIAVDPSLLIARYKSLLQTTESRNLSKGQREHFNSQRQFLQELVMILGFKFTPVHNDRSHVIDWVLTSYDNSISLEENKKRWKLVLERENDQ